MQLNDVVLIAAIFFIPHLSALQLKPRDITLELDAAGRDVVDAVIGKIRFFLKERSDYELLRRIAAVETNYGLDTSSTSNPNGGIWKIGLGIHNTLRVYESYSTIPALVEKVQTIFELPCFVCDDRNYSIPMHSGLAAYVFIKMQFLDRNIPGRVTIQANWWAEHYHEGGGVWSQFINRANEISYYPTCKDELTMDLWFLVDASADVTEADFQNVKDFSGRLRNYFHGNSDSSSTQDKVRFGWSMYSFQHEVIFKFSDSKESFSDTISQASRPLGSAETDHALNSVLTAINSDKREKIEFVHTVLLLITRDESPEALESTTKMIHESGISTYVVGFGEQNTSALEKIASKPSHQFSFFLNEYNSLNSFLADEIIRVLCSASILLQKEQVVQTTLSPGSDRFVRLRLPMQDWTNVNFSSNDSGLGSIIYLSAAYSNPNPAFYDFLLYLYGGFSEIALRGEEFVGLHPFIENNLTESSENMSIYVTITVPLDGRSRSSTVKLTARTIDPLSDGADTGHISSWIIVLVIAICLLGIGGALYVGTKIYRRSTTYQKSKYESKSRRETEEALYVMKMLQSLTDLVKKPSATLPSMTLLQKQLNFAENKEIPRDKLIESYNALTHQKVNIEKLRNALRSTTQEGKQHKANFQTMVQLQLFVEQGNRFELPDSELAQPKKVLRSLRSKMDPLHDRLKQYTENAKSSNATIQDMKKLEEKIDEATQRGFPTPMLSEAQDVLEKLQERVFTVKQKLLELTEESHYANPSLNCKRELDQELALARVLEIPKELLEPAVEALDGLRQEREVARKELLKETIRAKFYYPSIRLLDKLKNSILTAEKSKMSNEFLNEPKEILTRLEWQIAEHKELLQNVTAATKVEQAGYPDLQSLEKLLKTAGRMEIPIEELQDSYKLVEDLKNRFNPIAEKLKKLTFEAKQSTANLKTFQDLDEYIKKAKDIQTPSRDLEEPKKLLSILRKIDDSITKAKIDLRAALKSEDIHLITPVLNNVRNNENQILSWNPQDREFKTFLKEAYNLENFLIEDLRDKHKRIAALSKDDLMARLQSAIHSKHSDWHDLRRMKKEFEKVCVNDNDERVRRFLEDVRQAYLQRTKDYVIYALEDAIQSHKFENLENTLKSVHTILESEIPSEKNNSKILSVVKRAKTTLSKMPERARTKRQLMKEGIKAKMDFGFKMEELRGAVRDFEDEFGSSVEDDEEKEMIGEARRSIALKIKYELVEQLQTCLKTQTVNDLGPAIAKIESPLTHYLLEHYDIKDPQIDRMGKAAKKIHVFECEVQRQLDNVMQIRTEDIKDMLNAEDPPPVLYDSMKATLLLLGYSEDDISDWSRLKVAMVDTDIKKIISELQSVNVTKRQAGKAAHIVNSLDVEALKQTNKTAFMLFCWSKSMAKRALNNNVEHFVTQTAPW